MPAVHPEYTLEARTVLSSMASTMIRHSHLGGAAIEIDYTRGVEPMQEAAQNILLVLMTLFLIVDPLGGSPFFLALTREYSPEA